MYGMHVYALTLITSTVKNNRQIKNTYDTSCQLGGYEGLDAVADFAKQCKKIYRAACKALSNGDYIYMCLSHAVYEPNKDPLIMTPLSYREYTFKGYIDDIGLCRHDKVEGFYLMSYDDNDIDDIWLTSDTFNDIAYKRYKAKEVL